LDIISRSLIPSYREMKLKKLNLVRSNLSRESVYEKFKYLRIKFEELTVKVKQTEFQSLDDFLFKITEPTIELFVSHHFIILHLKFENLKK